jgi:hypothetical protein
MSNHGRFAWQPGKRHRFDRVRRESVVTCNNICPQKWQHHNIRTSYHLLVGMLGLIARVLAQCLVGDTEHDRRAAGLSE